MVVKVSEAKRVLEAGCRRSGPGCLRATHGNAGHCSAGQVA